MAYENGYEVKEYIGKVIDKYRQDSTIFLKTLQLLQVFSSRSDWPYCFEELDHATSLILGQSLSGLIFGFTQRYIDDENMIWPEDLPQYFCEELKSFHLVTSHIVDQFWYGRATPHKLFSIAETSTKDNIRSVRFIRYDGQFIDFEMDEHDLNKLIYMLEQLLESGR